MKAGAESGPTREELLAEIARLQEALTEARSLMTVETAQEVADGARNEAREVQETAAAVISRQHRALSQTQADLSASADLVADLKDSQGSLLASEERLRIAQRAGKIGTFEWNPASGLVTMSEEFCRIWGVQEEVLPLASLGALVHPEDRPRLRSLNPGAENNPLTYTEYRITRLDKGELRWIARRGEVQRDDTGQVLRGFGVIYDITEQKRAEESLRASEARLRLALDAGRMAVWLLDVATEAVEGSPELNRLLGFPADASPSISDIRARYYPGERERMGAAAAEAMARGDRYFETEFRVTWPDTSVRWLLLRAEFVLGSDGTPQQVVGVLLDITGRKQAEEHQQLLINELNHRVKNTLATVQSIASQTLRNATSTAQAQDALEGRLFALSRVHDVLTRENWDSAGLYEIVSQAMEPYQSHGTGRIHTAGPDRRVQPRMALALAMGLQELATNAVKYGALSNTDGQIRIEWTLGDSGSEPRLRLTWREAGGPQVEPPERQGFGTRLVERSLARDLDGEVRIVFAPSGVVCTFDVPVA